MSQPPYSLFSVFGVEIEYMIVDSNIDVRPTADKLIHALSGAIENEIILDDIAVNNELALHVIELKTNGPAATLSDLDQSFHKGVIKLNQALAASNSCLMPSGAHPWLDPEQGITLWPHGDRSIYEAYNRIFNCNGHGWGNLQSTHLNLPFANNDEFVALHQSIRLLLPIIPALTASTPFLCGKPTGYTCNRLMVYGSNQARIPIIAGDIIPEAINSIDDYHQTILNPIYAAIRAYDTDNILQEEWLNSRGAIARFDRDAIEIRIIDSQESPLADIACCSLIVEVLRSLIDSHADISTADLAEIYQHVIRNGNQVDIRHPRYLQALGIKANALTTKQIWSTLAEKFAMNLPSRYQQVITTLLSQGNLSERLMQHHQSGRSLEAIYHQLCECLQANEQFQ